ncbi:helix-turn-helix transcriptional regulator [Candidatus Woesearchaeota archaeon]|nr:helix-turn-helix transcriptional regulator [Candidatus Woesearchaeota archaeon]
MICKSYDYFFTKFANRANLEIIFLLKSWPMNVKMIIEKTGREQSATSHNLKKLCDCNILKVEKRGRERFYSLNKETVLPILELVQKHIRKNCKGCKYA